MHLTGCPIRDHLVFICLHLPSDQKSQYDLSTALITPGLVSCSEFTSATRRSDMSDRYKMTETAHAGTTPVKHECGIAETTFWIFQV